MNETATLRIRPAVEDDVPLVLTFIRELAEYERLRHEVVATEELIREALFGPRPYAEVVFAELDGQPVGFALFFHNFSTFVGRPGLYLEDLYVRPEFRGLGIGRRLLVHLATIAKERGCGRMEWSVLDWNEPAIRFYRSLGARPMDEWTVFRLTEPEIAARGRGRRSSGPGGRRRRLSALSAPHSASSATDVGHGRAEHAPGSPHPATQLRRVRPAGHDPGAVVHLDEEPSAGVGKDCADVVQVDDVGAVHPNEVLGVEPRLEIPQPRADQVRATAVVHGHVVVPGLQATDLGHRERCACARERRSSAADAANRRGRAKEVERPPGRPSIGRYGRSVPVIPLRARAATGAPVPPPCETASASTA